MGNLTTHILDTAHGCPAADVLVELFQITDAGHLSIMNTRTNGDGRCDSSLAEGDGFTTGTYEMHFHVGAYFRDKGVASTDPAFLDVVPIRFGVSSPDEHYHVPLLVSPYSYSTYRGS